MRLLPTLIALLALLPAAAAQDFAGVEITSDNSAGTASVDEAAEFTITVSNTGQSSGTPLDQPATVTLAASAPEGWSASIDPTSMQLAPGQSGTATVRVLMTADAQDDADVRVTADLDSGAPEQLGGTASDSITLQVSRSETVTRTVLEGLGDFVWLVFLALLAALLLASKFALDQRRFAVDLQSPTEQLTAKPGGRAAFPLTVSNISRRRDRLRFRLSPLDEGWSATLPVQELDLAPGDSEEMHLIITIPKKAKEGERQGIQVVAQSTVAPAHPGSVELELIVEE